MSNWIDSGGHVPRPCTGNINRGTTGRHRAGWLETPLRLGLVAMLSVFAAQFGYARDRGQFANSNPEIKSWFEGLKSGKGPCCSDADGSAVSDVDWESSSGHYRVRIEGEWVDVPEEAVITEPNRVGRTMVWPIHGYGGLTIRCFMPGSMT